MKHYVVGFLYQPIDGKWHVALVKKNKPIWQKGLWNGIGGKIEEGESPENAIVREFKEETGINSTRHFWRLKAILACPGGTVFFFAARSECRKLPSENDNGEHLAWREVENLPKNIITNLKWFVPLCLWEEYENTIMLYEKAGN